MKKRILFCALILAAAISAPPAYAYLDPGSGSLFLQMLLGGVAGLLVILRLYWRRILAFLGIRQRTKSR